MSQKNVLPADLDKLVEHLQKQLITRPCGPRAQRKSLARTVLLDFIHGLGITDVVSAIGSQTSWNYGYQDVISPTLPITALAAQNHQSTSYGYLIAHSNLGQLILIARGQVVKPRDWQEKSYLSALVRHANSQTLFCGTQSSQPYCFEPIELEKNIDQRRDQIGHLKDVRLVCQLFERYQRERTKRVEDAAMNMYLRAKRN